MAASGAENRRDSAGDDRVGPSVAADDAAEYEEWVEAVRGPESGLRLRLSEELEAHVLGDAV